MEPWLILGTNHLTLRVKWECINVGFGGVLDLREASKGEEVTVGVALIASAIVSPFQGILNGIFE